MTLMEKVLKNNSTLQYFSHFKLIPDSFSGTCYIETERSVYFILENRKIHNNNGPAIVRANGNKIWYVNGLLHRLDGPAIEDVVCNEFSYFINGDVLYTPEQYWNYRKVIKFTLDNIINL